ncbi:Leucine-rich repeat typical subtype [Penicillium longicatenatum]|nr:Leucine-rich repeat typical subtype [Penicillium longicatenatum]
MSAVDIGQRRSFDGQLCTIRYVGGVQGTTGDWLGVEWDDPTRGKHDGKHKGMRYFTCKSKHPTAGSFVRPSRPSEPPRSFLEALNEKYASEFEHQDAQNSLDARLVPKAIEISGKVVEEVGFDKIRKQQAELQELQIVLLDGLRISGVLSSYEQPESSVAEAAAKIAATCPKIIELDLSRSLFTRWRDVWEICNQLKQLKRLRLNGNRFRPLEEGLTFEGITELRVEQTLLTWDEISAVASRFPALTDLRASANQLTTLSCPLANSITSLNLEGNSITSISALRHLAALPHLGHLSVRWNNISTILEDSNDAAPDFHFPKSVFSLDLSRNNITSWKFLNHLPILFPGLTTLRVSTNPLYDEPPLPPSIAAATSTLGASNPMTVDEAFMLTLARFPSTLHMLNYSIISPQDRLNAEMYYLSLIGKELSATSEAEEERVLATHPRYAELCELYGEPRITRAVESDGSSKRIIHPRSVAARLVKMAFSLSPHPTQILVKEIPHSFNTYQLKALVSRLFDLPPYGFELVWETDEWDPVAKVTVDEEDWAEDSEDEMPQPSHVESTSEDFSRFVRREVELVDSTRDIGFLFQGETGEMKIRVNVL